MFTLFKFLDPGWRAGKTAGEGPPSGRARLPAVQCAVSIATDGKARAEERMPDNASVPARFYRHQQC